MLSVTAKHALRALVSLAAEPDDKPMLGKDLAGRAAIPANYLSKILVTLGNAGFISATRGTGGGYRLLKSPSKIYLVDIVDLFDKPRTAEGCLLDGDRPCSDQDACSAHAAWREVKAVYSRFLEDTTLAALAGQGVRRRRPGA
jgi:Rrf2 family protein